jgi:hypothetical protein
VSQVSRDNRRKYTAENFTPLAVVGDLLDKLGEGAWVEGATVLDPTCGSGNMLVMALRRKLELGHDPASALGTIYGADIMADNVKETRLRLGMVRTVFSNVVCTMRYEGGSLGYDYRFEATRMDRSIAYWVRNMGSLLAMVGPDGLMGDVPDSPDEVVENSPFD